MAGRYSKEYRPNEFVKLPFEEVAKVMAMKEQQYQQGYLQPAAYQQKMGELEVRTPDIEYHQKLINDATNKAKQLAEETYGGDYGAAASDITRTLANEASNPFYSWTKSKMDEYKKAKDIEMKLKAEGKYIGFDEGLLNTAYYDKETGNINKNLKSDLQEQLNYSDEMMKIWNYGLHEESTGSKADLASAEAQNKAGKAFIELRKSRTSGIFDRQVDAKDEQALALYMDTNAYKQQKRLLTEKQGMNEETTDARIAADMLQAGKFKKYSSTIDDSTVMSGNNGKSGGNGTDLPTDPITQAKAGDDATPNPQHKKNFDNFRSNVWNNFDKIAVYSNPKIKKEIDNINADIYKLTKTPGVNSSIEIQKMIRDKRRSVDNLKKQGIDTVKSSLISKLNQKDKDVIANDPAFQGMKSTVYSILNNPNLKYDDAEKLLEKASNSIQNTRYIETRNHKMSFNSNEIQTNLVNNIKNFSTDGNFKAIDEGGGKKYTREKILNYLKEDPNAGVVVRGDGELVFTLSTKDDGLKRIKVDKNSFSDAQKKQLLGVMHAEDIYRSYGDVDGQPVYGDTRKIKVPIYTSSGPLYPKITPGNPKVDMMDDNNVKVGELDISQVVDSYHRGFIGTNMEYTLKGKGN